MLVLYQKAARKGGELTGQFNEAYGIEQPNFELLRDLEKGFYATTQVLAKEYGFKELTISLNFLNSLYSCLDTQEEISG